MSYKGWTVEQLVKEAASRGLKPEAALEALLLKSDSEKSFSFGDLEPQVYTGWSLGQKKAFSAFEKKANTDFQSIKKNLGDHWTVTFLWEEMAKNCPQDAPNKDKVGKQIYESKFANLAKELASLDAEVVSALNDAVGSDTNITITIGEDKEKYLNGMDEVRYEGPQGGLKFVFSPRKLFASYPFNGDKFSFKTYILSVL